MSSVCLSLLDFIYFLLSRCKFKSTFIVLSFSQRVPTSGCVLIGQAVDFDVVHHVLKARVLKHNEIILWELQYIFTQGFTVCEVLLA